FFFFQAEDGIRDRNVTGVQTCALPISGGQQEQNSHHPGTDGKGATDAYQHGKKDRHKQRTACQNMQCILKEKLPQPVHLICLPSLQCNDNTLPSPNQAGRNYILIRSLCVHFAPSLSVMQKERPVLDGALSLLFLRANSRNFTRSEERRVGKG